MEAHYTEWKSVGAERAQNAIDRGGRVFKLPIAFGNGCAVYTHGIQTARGACYVLSRQVMRGLSIPDGVKEFGAL